MTLGYSPRIIGDATYPYLRYGSIASLHKSHDTDNREIVIILSYET